MAYMATDDALPICKLRY
ncbi:MAG: hypothetical protein CME72_07400 [Halomonadaceae bacterium]|nr:hypothetical protein [Halomonadaceae bacterium]